MICPSAPRCPSSATQDTGWATTSRLFARRTTFGVTLCQPVTVSAPVEFKPVLSIILYRRGIMAKGQFGKMLNCPFKGVCHEKEVFKWMLQKATFLSEQQCLPLLYLLSSLWKVESRMCWQEVAAITLSRSFFLFSSTKELGDLVNYLKYSRYARLQIFQFRV